MKSLQLDITWFLYLTSLFSCNLVARAATLRSRPVIGILSQPANKDHDYIAASYVKWLESAGARSIPIPYGANEELVNEILSQVNGVLFPGGDADLPPSAKNIWKIAKERNAEPNGFFPIWGTCLGFEFLVMLQGGEDSLCVSCFNSENISLPLIFPSEADSKDSNGVYSIESWLYPTSSVRETLSSSNITMNNHHSGISPTEFINNSNLTDLFRITSTNVDPEGKPFVSTIESIHYPIYGTQYHPEKNNFEFGLMDASSTDSEYYTDEAYEAINHSEQAVQLSMRLAMFFVGKVRLSTYGTYNMTRRHPVVYDYTMIRGRGFEQIFLIPKAEHWMAKDQTKDNNERIGYFIAICSVLIATSVFIALRSRNNFGVRFIRKHYLHVPG